MTKITQQDLPIIIIWGISVVVASYYWCIFVFKGGAEKVAGKTFIFKSSIMPPMSAKRLKILSTILYLVLIGATIALFL